MDTLISLVILVLFVWAAIWLVGLVFNAIPPRSDGKPSAAQNARPIVIAILAILALVWLFSDFSGQGWHLSPHHWWHR